MAQFKVHHLRFFDYQPHGIHCFALEEHSQKLALLRQDGSIEIWSIKDNWYLEKCIPPVADLSLESIIWCDGRLFSGSTQGYITEYDLARLEKKQSVSAHSGVIWCMAKNASETKLAVGTEDGAIVIFDLLDDNFESERTFSRQEGRILCIAWHVAEEIIITGGIDNIRIWSASKGHVTQRLTLPRDGRSIETIVWCVGITKDLTIVSGDSRGKTCFWNGKQGTLIKGIKSHKSDILSLCINKKGDIVFTSGVDPTLVQFEYIPQQQDSDWKMWMKTTVRNQHSHDVKALAITDEFVVSGGIDCNLIYNHLESSKGIKNWTKLPAIPHKKLVHCAKNQTVLLQYANYIELWKLGSTCRDSDNNGEVLSLATQPLKLLQLKSRGCQYIVSTSLSRNGDWIAISDSEAIRLYQVEIEDPASVSPSLHLHKVRYRPPEVLPSHRMMFSPDGSRLYSAAVDGSIQVIGVDPLQPTLMCTIDRSNDLGSIHLLTVSEDGKYLAVGDHKNNVHVYDTKSYELECKVPQYSCQPTAIAFSKDARHLAISYCDQMILEFDIPEKQYSKWSRNHIKKFHRQWLKRNSKIQGIQYNPSNQDQLIIYDEQMLCILDKKQTFPSPEVRIYNKRQWNEQGSFKPQDEHAFHISSKYKFILGMESIEPNWLLIVEKTPTSFLQALPDQLKQKKFGT